MPASKVKETTNSVIIQQGWNREIPCNEVLRNSKVSLEFRKNEIKNVVSKLTQGSKLKRDDRLLLETYLIEQTQTVFNVIKLLDDKVDSTLSRNYSLYIRTLFKNRNVKILSPKTRNELKRSFDEMNHILRNGTYNTQYHLTVYVLKCDSSYYYIGRTSNVERRLQEHREGKGRMWTRMH